MILCNYVLLIPIIDSSLIIQKQDITPVSVVDPFALYGDEYLQLRKFFAYSSQNLQECLAEAEVCLIKGRFECVMPDVQHLCLSLYYDTLIITWYYDTFTGLRVVFNIHDYVSITQVPF